MCFLQAPERLKGQLATAASDTWSLGLSLAAAALAECPIKATDSEFSQIDANHNARESVATHPRAERMSEDLKVCTYTHCCTACAVLLLCHASVHIAPVSMIALLRYVLSVCHTVV
jgi:serine/threonine protein kinase